MSVLDEKSQIPCTPRTATLLGLMKVEFGLGNQLILEGVMHHESIP